MKLLYLKNFDGVDEPGKIGFDITEVSQRDDVFFIHGGGEIGKTCLLQKMQDEQIFSLSYRISTSRNPSDPV